MRRAYLVAVFTAALLCACSRPEEGNRTSPDAGTPIGSAPPLSEPEALADAAAPTPGRRLVPFRGPIEHLFFHPLIAKPALAFDGDVYAKRLDSYFVTANEFRAILRSLYAHHFVLVGLDRVREPLLLPEGTKPIVLSVDDLNYYPYMAENGTASRLVLDPKDSVRAWLEEPDAGAAFSDDEVIPILDAFVREHPDFSHRGAKATLAVTGYKGLFGYHTEAKESETRGARTLAKAIADRLKANGWLFASHGFAHRDSVALSQKELEADLAAWKSEVEPIVGSTPIYIYPFGSAPFPGTPNYQAITRAGFTLLCEIGVFPYLQKDQDNVFRMGRRHIDGLALREQRNELLPFFDARAVIDPARRLAREFRPN